MFNLRCLMGGDVACTLLMWHSVQSKEMMVATTNFSIAIIGCF